ncbi:PREDICTED: putative odorant receptor 85d [Rhagoletis zephyria]|uniref:putative odorant receptor 85d n=1 Tax=Rhagoletis zephyria TaxID=28612 RepID=UPI00081163CF|nr:PREDICTED: putative odorant receptor 85d [Rhagoletis zephyria]
MNAIQPKSNFICFTSLPVKYFKFIGICLQPPEMLSIKCARVVAMVSIIILFLHQFLYLFTPELTFSERIEAIGILNYTNVAIGKIFSLIYNRGLLLKNYCELERIYPSVAVERHYKLGRYLRIYARVKSFLHTFFVYILIAYLLFPIAHSFYDLFSTGAYTYRMPAMFWYPLSVEESLLAYLFYISLQCVSCCCAAIVILSADLCLYNTVAQLLLHLDMLAQRILELQPAEKGSMRALKAIIEYHQTILLLAQDVNDIFAPSIIFSLASSSFILCFSAYQLLGDVSFVFGAKVLLLLCYEMKQVVITCYYGDKLIESSSRVFDVLYAHDWTFGSPAYKRLVLIMMLRTHKPIALNVAGIADVSLITLKQVLSTAYQVFAVLKTA